MKKLEIEMAIKEDRMLLPEFIQVAKLTAEKMNIYYEELTVAGFTEQQALDIVIDHGLDIGRSSWMDKSGGDNDED